jgi:hypothetical protein
MKPTKPAGTRLPLTGPIAEMQWVKVSRRAVPASAAKPGAADTIYGIRTSEDIVQARGRVRTEIRVSA